MKREKAVSQIKDNKQKEERLIEILLKAFKYAPGFIF